MISLVEASVCVASGFPVATGKHIGDCDLVPSTSALCTAALEAEEHNKHTASAWDWQHQPTEIGPRAQL